MIIRSLVVLLILMSGTALSQTGTGQGLLNDVGLDQKLDTQTPLDCTFRDENGTTVSLSSYVNGSRPVVLSFVYYECPGLCTEVLNGMVMAFRQVGFRIGKDYEVVTISINPREGSELAAQKKASYLHSFPQGDAGEGWHFLVGDSIQIQRVSAAVGFRFKYDTVSQQYAHPTGIMVLTPAGKVARYLYGVEYPYKDLRFALMEASENRIGSPVDKILLMCYHYDPVSGRYGVAIMNLIRIGGIITLVLLGATIMILVRRERNKTAVAAAADENNSNHGIPTPTDHRQ